jgi:ABC-type phosphate transport system substrate-binding protein
MNSGKLLLAAWWLSVGIGAVHAQLIIANPRVKVEQISKREVADIFTGVSSSFSDGSLAVPVTLKGGSTHEEFLQRYIGKTELLFRGNWRLYVFSGKGTMPKAFATDEEMVEYVASVPGAVGYVTAAPRNAKVKTLPVR